MLRETNITRGIVAAAAFLWVCLGAGSGYGQVPQSAADDFQAALTHFRAGRYSSALELLAGLGERFPENAEIQHLQAIVLDLEGRAEEANSHFQRAVELSPGAVDIRTNFGTSLMRLGRTDQAVAQFRRVLEQAPQHPTANFNLGTILLQREAFAQAQPHLERAFQAQPGLYENGYQLALCSFLLGDHSEAARVLEGLEGVPEERVEYHLLKASNDQVLGRENRLGELLSELQPMLVRKPAVRRQVVTILLNGQLFAEAVRLQEAAASQEPESDSNWLELARVRLAAGDAHSALEDAQRALRLQETGAAHALMGDILEQLDRPVEAVQHYQQAVALEPSEANLYALAYEFLAHWNWETAETVFERASQRFPQSWRLWLGLGASRLGQNENEAATRAFLRAIRISPQPLAYQLLALSFEQSESARGEAVAAFEAFYRTQPQNPLAVYYHALAAFRTVSESAEQDPEGLREATRILSRVASQHSDLFEAQFLLGEIHAFQQDWPRAVEALRLAVASRPDDVQARYKLGLALQRTGATQEARLQLQRYQTLKAQQDQAVGERMAATKRFIVELKQP